MPGLNVRKADLGPKPFKDRYEGFIENLCSYVKKKHGMEFGFDELGELVLSACRVNDFGALYKLGNKTYINENAIKDWISKRLVPSTVVMNFDDKDILRLLIFSLEITYQMFHGGSKATTTAKGYRQRSRRFESIVVDQFVGKLGEVMVKKFLKQEFDVDIELDWEISTDIKKFRNDFINAEKLVSVKTTPTLQGVWAEADEGYDYGVFVKCSVPLAILLQFFVETSGFTKLLDFIENGLPSDDSLFMDFLKQIRKRTGAGIGTQASTPLKGFVLGYFDTSQVPPTKMGVTLSFLGEVREQRHLVTIDKIKYGRSDWKSLLRNIGLKP